MKNVSENIFVIDDFLSEKECNELIEISEEMGYETATVETENGVLRIENVRNNLRALYRDVSLAEKLWDRIKTFAPEKIGNSKAVGLNELFRFYKYSKGNRFKKHQDNSFIRDDSEASYYTFMVYLNEEYERGETSFRDTIIKGEKGMALIFLHSLEHEGVEVLNGVKYVLRSDIMYRLDEVESIE